MRTHNIDIPIMPPSLALRLTLSSSNYPSLDRIFMVPKVFALLKYSCITLNSQPIEPGGLFHSTFWTPPF